MKKLPLLVLFVSLFSSVYAQKSFSTEPDIFIKEFTDFLNTPPNEELKPLINLFNENWTNGKVPEDQKIYVIKITNNIMYKGLSKDPYLFQLIKNLHVFYKQSLSTATLKQWQIITKDKLEKDPRDYLTFLKTAYDLFNDNTLLQLENRRWYASNSNFDLLYVNGEVQVRWNSLDLLCQGPLDTMAVYNTGGTYYPEKKLWVGKQGKVNWERVGLSESEMYCEFKSHRIDLTKTGFTVDTAYMINPSVSASKVRGRLIEQISHTNSIDQLRNSSYPKFSSTDPNIEIKGIVGDQAIYKGGFNMEGRNISSENTGNGEGKIILLYEGKPFVELQSKGFKLDSGRVMSLNASLKITVDTGFITHPSVIFTYYIDKKKIVIKKGTSGLMRMPFSDNYHGVEIDVEQVVWDQNTPYVEFDMVNNDKAARVETNTFFKKFLFDKVQGALNHNPLEKLFAYARRTGRRFTLDDYINAIHTKREYIIQQIMDLTDDGFILYNPENDSIFVKNKLFMWNSSAYGGSDYDVIRFNSVIAAKPNITYSVKTGDLVMQGVRRFTFSDSQNVVVIPTNQVISIKKDKNVTFGGMIRAGRIDFYAQNYNFNWQEFRMDNTTIDSMVIYYPDENTKSLRKVESVLSNTYGRILIDKPNNKSGLKDYPEYPIFIAERGSEINYDRALTHNHAYKKDKFKFEIDPFIIDSLDNFTIAGFGFGGTLVSDGIFPDIKNVARIQPDYSLGFVDHVTLPMYGGKGTGDLTINLSNRGFYGRGDLIYQTSVSKSNEYLLLPDATVGTSYSFHLPESGKYPLVDGHDVRTEWYPKMDKMQQTSLDSNFKVFKMRYDFEGKFTLSPADLRGDGKLIWSEAIFNSQDMVYGRNKVDAKVSGIKIFSVDSSRFAFESSNVNGHLDFDKRMGHFLNNQVGAYTHFPYNNYSSNMNDYKWDMTKKTMEVNPGAAMAGLTPIFAGLPQDAKDSIKFECKHAKFDLVKSILYMDKIPHIDIADSRVFPFDGKAVVREVGHMDPLDSSRILANRTDKFHDIKNCRTRILGGNNLAATGYYRYIDKYKVEQPLYVDSIRIDIDKHLVGYGRITEENTLKLDKKIGFKGGFKIISTRKPIDFKGFVKPLHSFDYLETWWLKYHNEVDPQNVVIDISDPRKEDDRKVAVGLFFATDSNHVYPSLFDFKRRYSDPEIQSDTGIFYYDQANDAFFAGNKGKLLDNNLRGNAIRFNEKDHSVSCEGIMDFQVKWEKMNVLSGGTAVQSADDSTFRFELLMWMNFAMPGSINSQLVKMFTGENSGAAASNQNTEVNRIAISNMIQDEKDASKMVDALEANGKVPADAEFKKGFVFSDVNFAYDKIKRKFLSTGGFSFLLCDGKEINKNVTGTIGLEKRRAGDKIYLYMSNDAGDWFYMEYFRGGVTMATNNDELLQAITTEANKMADEQFVIRLGSERTKDNFIIRNDIDEE